MKRLTALVCSMAVAGSLFFVQPVLAFGAQLDNLKGVWISSVYNLDFPQKGSTALQQQQDFIQKLDAIQSMGLNTVIVQVRPMSDALYQSDINPWSEVLTGTKGKDPGYDPLAFMIAETHKRGMEFHAWMNPYRITTSGADLQVLPETHPARKNPGWVLTYKNAMYYNPALSEVKQYICDSVGEVVRKYDVDAIHFDDYFYPANYPLNEGETKDGPQANQRRADVNEMIQMVSQTIKSVKPSVAFGVSPVGIWKNKSSDSTGSETSGSEGYYAVYGDARTWIQKGYVDYIAPQIYWPTGLKAADYETLVKWWANEVNGTNVKLYIGHAVYKDEVASQITTQLDINKKYNVNGSFYFSLKELLSDRQGAATAISSYYKAQGANNSAASPVTPAVPNAPAVEEPKSETPIEKAPSTNAPSNLPENNEATVEALFSNAAVIIDNKKVTFEAYNIANNNYFKLRDIAMAINKSQKQFNVSWDESQKAIGIQTNTPYAPAGSELSAGDGKDKKAVTSLAKLAVDGTAINVLAYTINDNTYFKLRDLASMLDFAVGWDDTRKTISIETAKEYQE